MISRELYKSLVQKYEAEIQGYKTTLMIYFQNPVGIGDHAEHLNEMDKLLSEMSSADDKLKTLKEYFVKEDSRL